MNILLADIRNKIVDGVNGLAAGRASEDQEVAVLNAIVDLQAYPISEEEVHITSELYAFIVDYSSGQINSEITNWDQAQERVRQLYQR